MVLEELMRVLYDIIKGFLNYGIFNQRLDFIVYAIHQSPSCIVDFKVDNKKYCFNIIVGQSTMVELYSQTFVSLVVPNRRTNISFSQTVSI